ncbi:WD repeat-containing protein 44-like [Neltuma alba]|uniref:WD repeat-containing protein 44-like n=1 Tax=Neltuma alba TaxID=207710 RepID=UPI0010A33A8D|nr:WD repeat-containing protein 44-like [Prosopis alba]
MGLSGSSGSSEISSKPSLGLERIRDANGAVSNIVEKETSEANILFDEMKIFPEDEVDVSVHENRHTEAEVREGHWDLDIDKKKKKNKKNWWNRFVNKRRESGGEKIRPKLKKGANKTHRIKVRQNKKRWTELSGLYVGQEITAHKGVIWAMKFSPNGQYLATGGEDGVVRIWRVVLQDISSDSFNAEDSLVTKVKQDMFCSWKKQSGQNHLVLPNKVFQIEESPFLEFCGHSSDVLDLAWSNNSEILLSSSMDKTVRLWQIGCDQCLSAFCHNDYVTCIQVNPVDENYFISGSIDGKVRIWGLHEKRVVDWTDIHDVITAISYKPDGKGFAVGSISGTCRLYVTSDQHCRLEAQVINGKKRSRGNKISGIQFCQEKHERVLITSEDSKFCLLEGIDVVQKYRGPSRSGSQTSGSFTSSGKHIISVGDDSHVYIWNSSDLKNSSPKRKKSTTRFCEYFFSEGVVVAVPWSGMNTDQMATGLAHCSSDLQPQMLKDKGECFSHSNWFSIDHTCRGSVTWPEEKLPTWNSPSAEEDAYDSHQQEKLCPMDPWGLSIVTASCDGIIKTFHNFGLPVRL